MGSNDVEAVYRAQHRRLWRSLLSYTCDPEMASDAESEAFTQAMRRGEQIADVSAWVWRAAFRIAAGMLAARSQDQAMVARLSAEPTLERSLLDFLALLGDLSEQQRACVALRYTGGFSASEIADMLGTSPGTVRVQLHRAHSALRASRAVGGDA